MKLNYHLHQANAKSQNKISPTSGAGPLQALDDLLKYKALLKHLRITFPVITRVRTLTLQIKYIRGIIWRVQDICLSICLMRVRHPNKLV